MGRKLEDPLKDKLKEQLGKQGMRTKCGSVFKMNMSKQGSRQEKEAGDGRLFLRYV